MALMSATSDRITPARSESSPAVDASMQLLREVMEHPVDPAYAMAARRRAGERRPGRLGAVVTVVLALVCGWVLTRGVAELRRPEPGQAASRASLEAEITRRSRQADAQAAAIERLRGEISAAQQAQLTSPEDVDLSRREAELALVTGEAPVVGPGIRITLDDAPSVDAAAAAGDPRADSGADDGRVLDRDIQVTVNGLWVAGAEAISINGRRLTTLSAIRSAGEAILVDFRPLVPPYVVSAIGDPAALQSRFTAADAAAYLQDLHNNYGVGYEISAASDLRLPGAGTFELRTARPVVEPSSTSPDASSSTPSGSSSAAPGTPTSAPSTEVSP
jgi:uncharacterized protein YlxW (UPF0749 family)